VPRQTICSHETKYKDKKQAFWYGSDSNLSAPLFNYQYPFNIFTPKNDLVPSSFLAVFSLSCVILSHDFSIP